MARSLVMAFLLCCTLQVRASQVDTDCETGENSRTENSVDGLQMIQVATQKTRAAWIVDHMDGDDEARDEGVRASSFFSAEKQVSRQKAPVSDEDLTEDERFILSEAVAA
eukprot:TRINITY_DN17059_c0_g1_i1.p2 TRINITY_DN17059_c0_g1~~TRINITY_DN17059_c0_g1_i1.p2  ORF type:complete len:110 (+),score=16.48 TRINITY_DN17059_c0_g1_i1:76-405(+)